MPSHLYLVIRLISLAALLACGGAATPADPPDPTGPPALSPTAAPSPTPVEVVLVATPGPSPTGSPTIISAMTPTSSPPDLPTDAPTDAPTPTPAGPLVNIGPATFAVELAITAPEHAQGLSGHDPLAPGAGMLFIFPGESRFVFWMKEMRFPLDIVWINAKCRIVDITLNAPAPTPDQALNDLPRFSPSKPARYVLEIHAGEAAAKGLKAGDMVSFAGTIAGEHGC